MNVRPPPGRAAEAGLLFVTYAAAAVLSIALSMQPGSVASLWFANAIAMGTLATAERARWPGLVLATALANTLANMAHGHGLGAALAFLPGNVAEVLVGAWGLVRSGVARDGLRTPRAMLALLGWGAVCAPLVGATVGAAVLQAGAPGGFWGVLQRWFEGGAIGAISLLGLVICCRRDRIELIRHDLLDPRVLALALVGGGVALLSLAHVPFPFVYTAIPLIVGAIVLEMTAALAVVLAASLVMAVAIGTGVFVAPPITAQWEELFVYMAYAAALVPAQLLSATMADLRDSQARLAIASAELEAANQGLEQFVHIASHDLREPLNTIVQFTGLVQHDHGAQLHPQARDWLSLVERAAARMRTLLDDVLHYTRVQRVAGDPGRAVALEAVLQEVLQSLAGRIRETAAVISADELPVVRGHASLLALCLQNLLSNALKFVPPGRRPEVRIGVAIDGDHALISVSDNGIGIAAEDIPRLFQPFQRLHLRKHYEGNGLGLALVKQIAVAHGGSVGLESCPGVGSRVTLRLPLEEAAARAPAPVTRV